MKEEIDMELEVRRMRISRFGKSKPKAMDPVCHMKVDMEKPPGGSWHQTLVDVPKHNKRA